MSLGRKYLFATVMCLVLPMLLFCVVCVDGLGYVYVFESYVVLDQCLTACLCSLSVRMVLLDFCVSFVSCMVMMSGWVLCTSFFSFSIFFLMSFRFI